MFGHERQPETSAHSVTRRAAAGETLEYPHPLAAGNAWPDIVDCQRDSVPPMWLDLDAGRAAGVLARILEQVGEDSLEPQLVDTQRLGHLRVDLDRRVAEPVPL